MGTKTQKAKETPEATRQAWERINDRLNNGGKLLIQITHTSRSGESYRYTIRLAYVNQAGQVDTQSLAYWVSAVTGESFVRQSLADELKSGGYGTDRFFLASLKVAHILASFGLVSDVYEIANTTKYEAI